MQIVSAQAANGSTPDFEYLGSRQNGKLNIYVTGDLGGGTLTLEAKAPNGVYVAVQTLTVGAVSLDYAPAVFRLTLTGATAPSFSAYAEDDSEYTQDLIRGR